jgi:hypothetical protein
MRRLLYTVYFLLGIVFQANAQQTEGLEERVHNPTCPNIMFNSTRLLPVYFSRNQPDTIQHILQYWQDECGLSEPLVRARLLFSIWGDSLNEQSYDDDIINYLLLYMKNHRESSRTDHYIPSDPIADSFGIFTEYFAREILRRKPCTPVDSFFTGFYANIESHPFSPLKDSTFNGTFLQYAYKNEVKKFRERPDGHLAFLAGGWIPVGEVSVLGPHPLLGLQGGYKLHHMFFNASIYFKFLDAPDTFRVEYQDSAWLTKHVFGSFFGIDVGYQLFRKNQHELYLTAGLAYDGLELLNVDNTPDNPNDQKITRNIGSMNINTGLSYRYYTSRKSFVGVEARFNFVDYVNKGGTDLAGNTITIALVYSFTGNKNKYQRLRDLDAMEE